ncbi:MAG: amidohydrolase/deacetylase family metallohydrolase [Acidobacteriota bacterium]
MVAFVADPVLGRLFLVGVVSAFGLFAAATAQDLDLLVKGGHVIDAKNRWNGVMDVGIAGGKIARVAPEIPAVSAKRVIAAKGLYVVPGLIDMHVHVFYGTDPDAAYSNGPNGVVPDGFTFRSGVTTVVDTGSPGWRNFPQFKRQVIDASRTRVLAFLNIVGNGMRGDPYEQDLTDMDPKLTAARVKENPGVLVGVKVAHYTGAEWDPVDRAVAAGKLAEAPVMVDFGSHEPELSLESLLLEHLRPGDVLTHMYAAVRGRFPITDEKRTVRPYVWKARERGIIFDVGHGGGSFLWAQAIPAVKQGFLPDVISTDLHRNSMNAGMKDMLNVISKLLTLGMAVDQAIAAATWKPAQCIQRLDLGHLSPGCVADVAVLRLREGEFGFVDVSGRRVPGRLKLESEVTIREGVVVWDLNGIAAEQWREN